MKLWYAVSDVVLDEVAEAEGVSDFYCHDCVPDGMIVRMPIYNDDEVGTYLQCSACGKQHEIVRELNGRGRAVKDEAESRRSE